MKVALVMVKADGSSKEVLLDRSETLIGRDESAKVRIPVPSVSRRHCVIEAKAPQPMVKDLGSSNGTFVNGRKVRETELEPGDLLSVGPVVFVVRIDGNPASIDAKECFAAGSVGFDDDDDDGPPPPPPQAARPAAPTAASAPKPATPPASAPTGGSAAGAPPGRKPLLDDDDGDDEDISKLLKDFKFDDDDDDDGPPAKPGAGPKK